MRWFLVLLLLLPLPGLAECRGRDLIAALPEAEQAALLPAIPFASGNLWTARRGEDRLLLVGTYHLDDPALPPLAAALAAPLAQAASLLVEIAPPDEARLKAHLAAHPDLLFSQIPLDSLLPAPDWAALRQAALARGTPTEALRRMRPWLAATLLDQPPCRPAGTEDGLDRRLMAEAARLDLPIRSLEAYDASIRALGDLPEAEQIALLTSSLATEDISEDLAATLTAAYLRGEAQAFVAFSRQLVLARSALPEAEIDRQIAVVEEALITRRNAAWIAPIEAAPKPAVVAFGALHLAGEGGVLARLAARGWAIAPYAPGAPWP